MLNADELGLYIALDSLHRSANTGSLTSAFQVFLGMQAGMTLLLFGDWKSRVKRWLVWGVACGAIGALLCLASKEQGWIPVNKNLWFAPCLLLNIYLKEEETS